ncbi:NAD(P)/FAD-dependent oxidoreductase [Planktotalea arctica]|uniref:NAD(P)/FAD-dependent oxidoreductase n=1 Tax=Planktotalea arctica TaxID=1481893 RepID=UPI0032191A8B
MPFESGPRANKNIAVIGAGISGLGAAHMLGGDNRVTLFEAEPRLGGHARTIMAGQNGMQPVDTGFIVFNYANYPHLAALFAELDVPVVKSSMSFGASIDGGRFEYGLASVRAVFAQSKNALDPRFLRMLRDITRFNAKGYDLAAANRDMTIGDFLNALGVGRYFRNYYLAPLSGAIWSTPTDKIMDFPAYAMMEFFKNHALLGVTGQHQWYTVNGGSSEYVRRVETSLKAKGVVLRLGCPIDAVRRVDGAVEIKAQGGGWEGFDEVIFATHSDDSLRLLADPSEAERLALSKIAYQPNDIILHADASVMPKRKVCWSSWNYTEEAGKPNDRIDLTYWMNSLQPIPANDPHFVTLNTNRTIREDLIYDQVTLRHPVYDLAALNGQREVAQMNGTNKTWFCGAWMKNGFHEDGLSSAVDVVEAMRSADAMGIAAQ